MLLAVMRRSALGAAAGFTLLVGLPATAPGRAAGSPQAPRSNAEKLRTLDQACKVGVLTPQECEAKRKALTKRAPSAGDQKKLAALDQACKAGVFTPQECEAKRRAILGENDESGASAPAPAPPAKAGGSRAGVGAGVYRDPQHRFSLLVPTGWTAAPSGEASSGSIQLQRGGAVVIVGSFGGVREARDAVASVVNQFMRQYKQMQEMSHGDFTLNSATAAYAMFGGRNQKGVAMILRIVGVDAPGEPITLIANVPKDEVKELSEQLAVLENSFALGDTPNTAAAATEPPTGAMPGGSGSGPARNPNRASLGVAVGDIAPEQAQQMGLKDNRGALITQVVPGGAAERAGLQPGDFVVAIQRASVTSAQDMIRLLGQRSPGDTVEIILLRGGRPKASQATLAASQ